jgi:prophage maintenance system killer protein
LDVGLSPAKLGEFWYLAELWACLVMFIDLNDGTWAPGPPEVEDSVDAMLQVAARTVDEGWLADWLRQRVSFTD